MNRKMLFINLLCAIALGGCSSDSDDDNQTTGGGSSPDVETPTTDPSTDTSADATTDFEVSWDIFADADFADTPDTPATDDEAEDFIENSSFPTTISIAYDGTSATVTGEAEGVSVAVDGGHVVVTSTAKGIELALSGEATDGSLKVYSEKKFKISLNGVSLTSQSGAAINIQSKKRIFVCVADGTENTLTDAADYTNDVYDEDQKAALFSEGQLIFCGSGSLTVSANHKHAICSDDYVVVHSGVRLTVSKAPKDAIHTNGNFVMGGGLVCLTTSGDGIECEEGGVDIRGGLLKVMTDGVAAKGLKATTDIAISGGQVVVVTTGAAEYDADENDISSSAAVKTDGNLSIANAEVALKSTGLGGKGVNVDGEFLISSGELRVITTGSQYVVSKDVDSSPKGIKAEGPLTIEGGTVMVRATGGEGSEGIESKDTVTISGGTVVVYTADDCINATNHIEISGGNIYCYGTGNDAIDSNGTLTISGGTVVAIGTDAPEAGFDCDENTFTITGGTILGIGGSTSRPTASVSTQPSVIYGGTLSKGQLLTIAASDGSHVMTYTIPVSFSSPTILFSSPSLTQGQSYALYTGGEVSGGTAFQGLVTGASYVAGTSVSSFTISSMLTTVGQTGGNQPGGGPGGRK